MFHNTTGPTDRKTLPNTIRKRFVSHTKRIPGLAVCHSTAHKIVSSSTSAPLTRAITGSKYDLHVFFQSCGATCATHYLGIMRILPPYHTQEPLPRCAKAGFLATKLTLHETDLAKHQQTPPNRPTSHQTDWTPTKGVACPDATSSARLTEAQGALVLLGCIALRGSTAAPSASKPAATSCMRGTQQDLSYTPLHARMTPCLHMQCTA